MYVNYYEQEMMNEGDNKPIGIVLCAEKNIRSIMWRMPPVPYRMKLMAKGITGQ